jgi:hypothetical protein
VLLAPRRSPEDSDDEEEGGKEGGQKTTTTTSSSSSSSSSRNVAETVGDTGNSGDGDRESDSVGGEEGSSSGVCDRLVVRIIAQSLRAFERQQQQADHSAAATEMGEEVAPAQISGQAGDIYWTPWV